MKIKLNQADINFSKVIRERNSWTCEKCSKHYPEGNTRGLECAHIYSRRHYSIRFDPDNAFSLCTGCHMYFTGEPLEFAEWTKKQIGQGIIDIISEKKRDTLLAKINKKSIKEIAKHYKAEFERMRELRKEGQTGRIEIVAY